MIDNKFMGDLGALIEHQATKNWLLTEFMKASSSELSFRRRSASLSLLDALCHLTGRDAKSLFQAPMIDAHRLIKQHQTNPFVASFLLNNNINPEQEGLSVVAEEAISCSLMELTKHLA